MSRETQEYLRNRYGMSGFAGMGYDLSRPDRLEAAGDWLDSLFGDFTEWLMEQPAEPTTAPEVEEYADLHDHGHVHDEVAQEPTLKVVKVTYWRIGSEDPLDSHQLWAKDYPDLNVSVDPGSIGISYRSGKMIQVISLPRDLYGVSWILEES